MSSDAPQFLHCPLNNSDSDMTAGTKHGEDDREAGRNSPEKSQPLGPARQVVIAVERVDPGQVLLEKPRLSDGAWSRFGPGIIVSVLTLLCFSELLQWRELYLGERCRHNDPTPPAAPGQTPQILKETGYPTGAGDLSNLQRNRRDVDSPNYITREQYIEDRSNLLSEVETKTTRPSAQLVLQDYMRIHEIDNQHSFHWEPIDEQSLFNLTPAYTHQELKVLRTGYYDISLTAMFNGRNVFRQTAKACSILLVAAPTANVRTHKTLMHLARTQDQMGRNIGNSYPYDTVHDRRVLLLAHGDVLYVRPGKSHSLGCRLMTDPDKTHLDAVFLQDAII